jgi:hypothetical protein
MKKIKKIIKIILFILLLILASIGIGLSGGVPLPSRGKRTSNSNFNTEQIEKQRDESNTKKGSLDKQ